MSACATGGQGLGLKTERRLRQRLGSSAKVERARGESMKSL